MSMWSSPGVGTSPNNPISGLLYRDVAASATTNPEVDKGLETNSDRHARELQTSPSVKEIEEIVAAARSQARVETEERLRTDYEKKDEERVASMRQTIDLFAEERKDYFGRVESEVVHLALAIAAKILHRESQIDPTLLAALVRVAVEKLHDGCKVSIRVSPLEAGKWRDYMTNPLNGTQIEIVEDDHLGPHDAVLETNLGSADFSIDAQLKEVEQGFFDLLAQRPGGK
jgi:flagellar assembly protein FliH